MNLPPLTFQPILMQRVWGGRKLATLFSRQLPDTQPYGESWDLTDRPEGCSVVDSGPFKGSTLRELMVSHREALLGQSLPTAAGRFPWLFKILDATDVLSLQVHPPAQRAAELGGEPKTEMWYVVQADPGAVFHAGLKPGVDRARFEQSLANGTVADCFHRIPVKPGDALFLPSGRVHALGAGIVIMEIQQNSDTTYRVHDWDRPGLDGRPRPLHVRESLLSIDFGDVAPRLAESAWRTIPGGRQRPLVEDPLFHISTLELQPSAKLLNRRQGQLQAVTVVHGLLTIESPDCPEPIEAGPGRCVLFPASCDALELKVGPDAPCHCLWVEDGAIR